MKVHYKRKKTKISGFDGEKRRFLTAEHMKYKNHDGHARNRVQIWIEKSYITQGFEQKNLKKISNTYCKNDGDVVYYGGCLFRDEAVSCRHGHGG